MEENGFTGQSGGKEMMAPWVPILRGKGRPRASVFEVPALHLNLHTWSRARFTAGHCCPTLSFSSSTHCIVC
jgi:hypothetical protein